MNTPVNPCAAITWQHRDQLDQPAIALDINGKLDKTTMLRALRESFSFPDYFGDNWDAVYDLLLDHVEQLQAPAIWRFSIDEVSELNEADLADWIRLMIDLCTYAESQAQSLQVVVYSDLDIEEVK